MILGLLTDGNNCLLAFVWQLEFWVVSGQANLSFGCTDCGCVSISPGVVKNHREDDVKTETPSWAPNQLLMVSAHDYITWWVLINSFKFSLEGDKGQRRGCSWWCGRRPNSLSLLRPLPVFLAPRATICCSAFLDSKSTFCSLMTWLVLNFVPLVSIGCGSE